VSRSDIMTLAIGFVVQEGLLEVNAAVLVASLRKTYGKSIELVVCARLCFFVLARLGDVRLRVHRHSRGGEAEYEMEKAGGTPPDMIAIERTLTMLRGCATRAGLRAHTGGTVRYGE
jgi:hypothetical protein